MKLSEATQVIQALEQAIHFALDAGFSINELFTDIQTARNENRLLTDEELDRYAKRAAAAVERL